MDKRMLGGAFEVSAIGLGCMGMSHAYGPAADRREMAELLAHAVDAGCTFFDTAESYGFEGHPHDNEELLGEALAPFRDKIRIATKFGIGFDWGDGRVNHALITDARPATIRASVEGSLKRLKTDRIDLYYQHRQDPEVPVEEVAGVMAELISEGKILAWGLSEADPETIRRADAVCHVAAIQDRYSMMARWHEDVFGLCEELGTGFVAFSPLANGFLSGAYMKGGFDGTKSDYRAVMPQFTEEGVKKNRGLIELLREVAAVHDATPAQISLAWMLCKRPFIVPIPGTRRKERLDENFGAAAIELSGAELAAIDEALGRMPMSDVFGGSSVKAASRNQKTDPAAKARQIQ